MTKYRVQQRNLPSLGHSTGTIVHLTAYCMGIPEQMVLIIQSLHLRSYWGGVTPNFNTYNSSSVDRYTVLDFRHNFVIKH